MGVTLMQVTKKSEIGSIVSWKYFFWFNLDLVNIFLVVHIYTVQ